MIIKKKGVKASSTATCTKHQEAITHIRAAIDALGPSAKEDVVAKESIANLSVVLLDLKH